ncbi:MULTISPECIES: biotin-independent malonate decarboxylase subunit beta [Methylobacterium]|uniref:Biotin-independent malonate decarboxylase subunit beta n=1 Tax=Methylobacterium longum TaxID=767694 RepID=A0ABT8AHE6_9HYPH|nr:MULTISPECIES: biotin-independent malonate decarboxylase subunit beta [Methylobacterium]MCJ2100942.1 biotin-independent malonate decarboxylase subunit beta [Methylobacterium sp. E-046]MDN3569164.1 biotin-independent malonate decarboxylase subunit beta [Methylobacterium longum]GJE10573.1 Malonyl-S-ACP:biotin-protein carboxyltransferase MADC [Methylobacterium longum]
MAGDRAASIDPDALSWYEATARQRVTALVDPGSFREFLGPTERRMSPHLPLFDLPRAFDDGIVIGRADIAGTPVLLAAQEGRFMGGAFGEVHGGKLVGLLRAALDLKPRAVLILFDTGGVRLQEANAGETAIAEAMRAIVDVRAAGIPVVGLIGGRAGCYGGGGLIAGTCSRLAVSEGGRISVSGPEVIETNKGAEEFDSRDRALVWRTMGGKHRRLTGGADAFCADTVAAFRQAAVALIDRAPAFDLAGLEAEQARLAARIARFGDCRDATEVWARLGVNDPATVPGMDTAAFEAIVARVGEADHDAR